MSKRITGPAKPSELEQIPIPDHDGDPCTQSDAKITNTGDGLSETLKMRQMHIPVGTRVMILVPAIAVSHEYDRVKTGRGKDELVLDEFIETTVLKAEGALFLDPDLVNSIVQTHNDRVTAARNAAEKEKREAKGEFQLPMASEGKADGATKKAPAAKKAAAAKKSSLPKGPSVLSSVQGGKST